MESNILSILAISISVGTTIVGIINHKKIRSKCCGRELSASVDIEPSTPPVRLQITEKSSNK